MSPSDDDAQSFTPISPDLSNGPGRETNPLFKNFGTLTTIAPAGKSTGTIYAGTDDGNLWYTHDGGGSWTKASDPDLPKAWITRVEVVKGQPNTAYVTYSGFRQADDAAYILRTTDGGKSWDNITGDLPRAPLNDVNAIGDALVVAGDFGVFASNDQGAHWLKIGANLPLAPVFELRYHAGTNTLYAATFGRSIWKVSLNALPFTPAPAAPAPKPAILLARRAAPTLGLPAARRCRARGRLAFRLRAPKGVKLKRARIYVDGRRVRTVRGRALRRTIRLRVRRATRVRVTAVTTRGRTITVRRTYHRCR